jgi:hypothetical protein
MAPEMVTKPEQAGTPADVYSAGATIVAMLTGEEPLDAWAPKECIAKPYVRVPHFWHRV